jgi:transcriptional regulator with XRE-family HTH domain
VNAPLAKSSPLSPRSGERVRVRGKSQRELIKLTYDAPSRTQVNGAHRERHGRREPERVSTPVEERCVPLTFSTASHCHALRIAKACPQAVRTLARTIQILVSDYERDRIRVTAEMVVRLAEALEISADELLGMKKARLGPKASRRVLRRVERVEQLPPQQQATLLRTIDTFLKAAGK